MESVASITVRVARLEDAEYLVAAEQKSAHDRENLIFHPDEITIVSMTKRIEDLSTGNNGRFLVAELNGEIVGHGTLEYLSGRSRSHVLRLSFMTHHGHMQKSVGSEILKHLLGWARDVGALKIEVFLRIWNRDAYQLLRKFGFQQEGILSDHVRVDEDRFVDDIVMGLALNLPELKNVENGGGAVIFFPWLQIDTERELDDVILSPHPLPEGREYPKQVHDILNLISGGGERQQGTAVVVRLKTKLNFEVPSKDERTYLFELAQILAFNALSERELFSHSTYYNSDTYKLHIQGFTNDSEYVVIESRRRDGGNSDIVPFEYYSLKRPFHVSVKTGIFEGALLTAMLQAFKSEKWAVKYSEAISLFNSANTDDISLDERTEVVRMVSAFERLYELSYSKDRYFSRIVTKATDIVPKITPTHQFRLAENVDYKKSNSVKAVWSFDIYHARNHHAHGHGTPAENKVWTTSEHLILACYLFPLALKIELERDGFYQLTEEDKLSLFTFDHIASQKSLYLNKPQHEHGPKEDTRWPVAKAKWAARWDWNVVNMPQSKV